jgi:hypothetical protein
MFLPTAVMGFPSIRRVLTGEDYARQPAEEAAMKRVLVCVALLLVGSTVLAETPEGYERFILSIAPSYAWCARFSRYDTRLHIFNEATGRATPVCYQGDCAGIEPRTMTTVEGPASFPLPAFIYVPRAEADRVHLSLMAESTNYGLKDRAFTELPVLRERDFRRSVQLLGVRVDDGFRVTLRVYGLDVPDGALATMRIYEMETNALLYEQVYGFQRFPNAPSVAMECDVRNVGWGVEHRNLRIEVESSGDDAPIYAFVSTTDNSTQRFTVITPK